MIKKKKNSSSQVGAGERLLSKTTKAKIKSQSDWRADILDQVRTLIQKTDPEAVEEIKWRKPSNPAGVPVWSHGGIICTGETYKDKVKVTFAKGAALAD